MRKIAKLLVELVHSIPGCLHEWAERLRTETLAHRELLRAEGLPAEYVQRQGAFQLAWADLLDALVAPRTKVKP
jgi:hypothetical protein